MAIVLAFGCALVYGIADYCGGRASRTAPSVTVSLIGQLTSLVLVVAIVAVMGTAVPPLEQLAWGATAGVATAFALTAFYHALSFGAMTVVAPITAVLSAVVPVAFAVVRGERPGAVAYLGMAVAVGAVALVSGAIGVRHVRASRATIAYAGVAGLGFALIFVALGQTDSESGMWPLVAARLVSVGLMVGVVVATGIRVGGRGDVTVLAVFAGVLDMLANVLYLLAVQRGLLAVVVVVAALYPVSTVGLAFIVDRERVSRSQTLGIAMALGALVLVSVSGAT